jgi:hypothetical protein
MSLAQVCYNISNDRDFAALWRRDPDEALAKRGLKLSREEKAFLFAGLQGNEGTVSLKNDILKMYAATRWV